MSVVVPYKAIDIVSESKNPKKAIIDFIGNLDGIHIPGDQVLIATYVRPRKTSGGIIRPDENVTEDIWQGKAGLVLKLGTTAFQDTLDFHFHATDKFQPGDWCVYKVGDAWAMNINGYPCRLVRDVNIRLRIDDPNIVL
jgi:hypothetical protein